VSAVRYVTATCACGATFQREVKRGRPQVWCEPCRETPFYERAKTQVPISTEAQPTEAPKPRPTSQFDRLAYAREQIEAQVAEVNAAWPAKHALLLSEGLSLFDAATVLSDELRAVYAPYKPAKDTDKTEESE
jgi:hypothetical protein